MDGKLQRGDDMTKEAKRLIAKVIVIIVLISFPIWSYVTLRNQITPAGGITRANSVVIRDDEIIEFYTYSKTNHLPDIYFFWDGDAEQKQFLEKSEYVIKVAIPLPEEDGIHRLTIGWKHIKMNYYYQIVKTEG